MGILRETRGAKPVSGDRSDPSRRIHVFMPESLLARLDAAQPDTDRAIKIREACEQWLSRRGKIYGRQL